MAEEIKTTTDWTNVFNTILVQILVWRLCHRWEANVLAFIVFLYLLLAAWENG